ncbi:MAG TPA: phosphoglucosamine mutase [Mycobacteriales bacterium]
MPRLFGTDGVRGLANADLSPLLATSLALGAAQVLRGNGGGRQVAVVGRDPRASGEMLEAAVVAGLTSAGTDVLLAGIVPTPAVAYLTADLGADLGVMISASHNPMPDNGIKFFDAAGRKLADAVEDEIEERLREEWDRPVGAGVGRVRVLDGAAERYATHLLGSVPAALGGLRVVIDAAHGAAHAIGPEVYAKAGASVQRVGCEPDGLNINDGVGSTHLEQLRAAVLAAGADLGLAHDGDADRCLAVDARGETVDGDEILAICALALREQGALRGDTVVTTVMTNLGFTRAMDAAGIAVVQTAVGDRYVLEAMRERDAALGGEQSGHVVFADRATTGDGLLTGLAVMSRMAETQASLADLAAVMTRLPQVLLNVPVADRRVATHPDVVAAAERVHRQLGADGRVLLRPSGTEPIVRVMVEAPTHEQAEASAAAVADVVRRVAPAG